MIIEVSIGEVFDKLSILEIKTEKIKDEIKLNNVKKEYNYLLNKLKEEFNFTLNDINYIELKNINQTLWDIEDNIRIKEKNKSFDQEFINLARNVYITNDKRAEIKKKINISLGSNFIEEKEYIQY